MHGSKEQKAEKLYKFLFRPPRPPYKYAEWMDDMVRISERRVAGEKQGIGFSEFQAAFDAGLRGDKEALESFLGLYELARE